MADSLKAIAEFLQSERPDGVLAFSQGASATALLLSVLSPSPGSERVQADRLAELGLTTDAGVGDIPLPKFVVLVGPFLPNDASWAQVRPVPWTGLDHRSDLASSAIRRLADQRSRQL